MGIQDRDWYREAIKEKLRRQEEEENWGKLPRFKNVVLRKPWIRTDGKTSIWELIFKMFLIFTSCILIIELALKAKGLK